MKLYKYTFIHTIFIVESYKLDYMNIISEVLIASSGIIGFIKKKYKNKIV